MRVRFLIENEESEESEWRDFWIDNNLISGFYMPNLIEGEPDCINVLYDGAFMTFKQEADLVKYLEKRFVLDE